MKERPSLHALALFLATVEHGTMTAAAEAEGIAQPAISVHIRNLERFYETALVERSGRRVRPTAAGELAAADSRFAGAAEHHLTDLAKETFVLREPGSATREAVLGCMRTVGFAPANEVQLGSNEAVKRAVAAGLGIGVLSVRTLDVDLRAGDVAIVPCINWDCRRQFWLVNRADRLLSRAEQAFLALL